MSGLVEIRNFESGDIDAVLSLLHECFDHLELEDIDTFNLLEWYRQFPRGLKVAIANGRVVGFVFAFAVRRVGWITLLCVKPEFRRQGIGTRLLESALKELANRRVRTIKLDVDLESPALELYKKFGFEVERKLLRLRKSASKS